MVQYSEKKRTVQSLFCGPKCLVFKWSAKSCDFDISIPDTHTVWYSDESGIQVFGIQMVIVYAKITDANYLYELTNFSLTEIVCHLRGTIQTRKHEPR